MKKVFYLIAIVISLSACEKALFKKDKASNNARTNFEYLWNEVDKKYSYFELKNVNWDSIKTVYGAQISESTSEYQLFEILANMMNELKDDHTNLISPFNISRYDVALNSDANFRLRTIEEFYIPNAQISGSFLHDFLEDEEIGYIRYSSFMNSVSSNSLDYILSRYKNTKGLILDLRENGGGSIINVPALLERFAPERKLVGYFKTRNGENHTDFSENSDFYIGSHDGIKYTKPVMVLIDRGSYSATTMFALATKAFANITLIGDSTGGGGGLPNGGQLPNGWIYRFSISQLLDLNGNNFAEKGVSADINVSFEWTDLTKDEIIERAIIEIMN